MPYYLQFAAQPYYNHTLCLSDPMIQGGATFFPWLQYIPFVILTRWMGLSVFGIQVLWTIAAAVGTGVTLYLFLWLICRNRWLAAGITICLWADIDLGRTPFAHRFLFVHPIYMVASDLFAYFRGHQLIARPPFPFQFRLTNPALDEPFLFLQLILTSLARERPRPRNLALSGLLFALTFYVYFYLWTVIAAGLCLAILVDRAGRRTYFWTLALGFALGWPEIVHDYLVKRALSPEGLRYFGLMATPRDWVVSPYPHPYLILAELIIIGVWVIHRKAPPLILAWCMSFAGIGMSLAIFVTGFFVHNYHWGWVIVPLLHITMAAAALDLVLLWKPRLHIPAWAGALLVGAYLASGIYLAGSILLRGSPTYRERMTVFSEYTRQRLAPGVIPLRSDSVIAGDWDFVDLAASVERQRPLAGNFLEYNTVLDDEERRNRFALDQYLLGTSRESFTMLLSRYRSLSDPDRQFADYMRTFDEVSRDPDRFIDNLKVQYLVLPAAQPAPPFLDHRWNLIQQGPYFRIWERIEK